MRKRQDKKQLKFACFLATPDTADYDSLVEGLEQANRENHINIKEVFEQDPELLFPRTTWFALTESFRKRPIDYSDMRKELGVRDSQAKNLLKGAIDRGRVFYFYAVDKLALEFVRYRIFQALGLQWVEQPQDLSNALELMEDADSDKIDYLRKKLTQSSLGVVEQPKQYRLHSLSSEARNLPEDYPQWFSTTSSVPVMPIQKRINVGDYRDIRPWIGKEVSADLKTSSEYDELIGLFEEFQGDGWELVAKSKLRLPFYFIPKSPHVLTLLAANCVRLSEIFTEITEASRQGDLISALKQWSEEMRRKSNGKV